MKEMNGAQPFVYLQPCGCVFSQAGLKTVTRSTSPKEDDEGAAKQLDVCPQCATKFNKVSDVLVLNPPPDEEERMYTTMTLRRASEPSKTLRKRKGAPADDAPAPPAKKLNQAHTNPSISAASRAVVSSLATEEAKRKAGMSEAVKSLYSKKSDERKETFMTMGTFTRVSPSSASWSIRALTIISPVRVGRRDYPCILYAYYIFVCRYNPSFGE